MSACAAPLVVLAGGLSNKYLLAMGMRETMAHAWLQATGRVRWGLGGRSDRIIWALSATLIMLLAVAAGGSPTAAGQARDGGSGDDALYDGGAGDPDSPAVAAWLAREPLYEPLRRVYEQRLWRPIWVDADALRPEALPLLNALRRAELEGLNPDHYAPPELIAALQEQPLERPGELDLALSMALVRYAQDLRGRAGPPWPGTGLPARDPAGPDPATVLARAAASDDLASYLASLAPANRLYRDLRRMLIRHRSMARNGGWPRLSDGPVLRLGSSGPRVEALRARLQASHDFTGFATTPTLFDADLERAVRRFQERHGLIPDGIIGQATLNALNVPVDQRIRQIRINMARMRRMPDHLGERHLLVNIPGFDLRVIDGNHHRLTMRVVVGRPSRPTPVFSSGLSHLVLNPYWHVPRKIAARDLLPKLKQAPEVLARQGIRVLSGWSADAVELDPREVDWEAYDPSALPFKLRQDPGPDNALGRIKFMLPNEHSVYLHDTPSRALFDDPVRAYSSGCVRLEAPVELAAYLYDQQGWPSADLHTALASGRNLGVPLRDPVPVHITYRTAWLDHAGRMAFRPDVYGWDDALATRLDWLAGDGTAVLAEAGG